MPLSNYQASYNGLTWGPGTDIQLAGIEGLTALPEIRGGDVVKPRRDGVDPGLNFLGQRVVILDLEVFAPKVLPFATVLAQIATAFQSVNDPNDQQPMEFLLPGWSESRRITGRPTKAGYPIDVNYQFNKVPVAVEFTCADPLIYGSTLKSASAGLPSPTAGLTFPVTFNVTFGASTGGSFTVTNNGTYLSPPVFTITGPVTNPRLTFTSTGAFFALNIALGASDVLVIDMGKRSVTLNGTASRLNTIVSGSSWFGFPTGTWSIGVSSSDASPVAALFTANWRDAWGFM
jgi:Phage tail protein